MIIINDKDGIAKIVHEFTGQGEHLAMIQKALLLGIECIGSHEEHSGYEDHQQAVWLLSTLLRSCMLDESQTNVALGGHPYANELKKAK